MLASFYAMNISKGFYKREQQQVFSISSLNGHQDFTECGKLENYKLGDSNAKIRISVP